MAIITLAAPLSGLRGTLAGIVYSENASGPYAKRWRKPPTTKTPARSSIQSFFSSIGNAWANLSSANRILWDTWAALPAQVQYNSLGQPYHLSGFQIYRKISLQMHTLADTIADTPPSGPYPATSLILNTFFRNDATLNSFGCSTNIVATGSLRIVMTLTIQQNTKAVWKTSNFRTFAPVRSIFGSDYFWDVLDTLLEPIWGPLNIRQRGFCSYFVQSTEGLRSVALNKTIDWTTV